MSIPARLASRRTIRRCAVAVEAAGAVPIEEDRTGGSFAEVEIDRPNRSGCEWDGGGLVAFAVDEQGGDVRG